MALNTITITLTIGSLLFATHSVFSIRVFVEILYCQSWKTKGIIVPIMPSSQVHYNFSTHLFIIIWVSVEILYCQSWRNIQKYKKVCRVHYDTTAASWQELSPAAVLLTRKPKLIEEIHWNTTQWTCHNQSEEKKTIGSQEPVIAHHVFNLTSKTNIIF